MVPIIQNSATSRVFPDTLYRTFIAGGGSVTVDPDTSEIIISIGTGVGDYALVRSKRPLTYRSGFCMICRFASLFDTPLTNSLQFNGVGNSNSDIYIGYNGLDFGVRYSTNGQQETWCLMITTASNNNGTASITLDGTLFSVPITNAGGSTDFTAYEISLFNFTGWTTHIENSMVCFAAAGAGSKVGVFTASFSNNTSGTFTQTAIGSPLSTTFVPLANCNGDASVIASLDISKYNMYQITYAWYGSSPFELSVLDPDDNIYRPLHTFRFNNRQTSPSLTYPNMYIQRFVASLGSTTALTLKTLGSFAGYLGTERMIGVEPQYSIANTKTFNNQNTPVIALKHRDYILGRPIQSEFFIGFISATNVGSKPSIIRVVRNPTTIGTASTGDFPIWLPIQNSSITLRDFNSNTYTGGEVVSIFTLAPEESQIINLGQSGIFFGSGDTAVVSAQNSQSTEVSVAIQVIESIV